MSYNTCSEIDRPSNGVAILTTPSRNKFLSISERVIAMHFLYVICASKDTYKIGITANVEKRIYTLQISNPSMLKKVIIAEFETEKLAMDFETAIHSVLSSQNIHGEWVVLNHRMINGIEMLLKMAGANVVRHRIHAPKSVLRKEQYNNTYRNIAKTVSPMQAAIDFLTKNPDYMRVPVREVASVLGIGKTTVADAKRIILNHEQSEE